MAFFEEASDKLIDGEYGSNRDEALLKIKDDILDGVYTDFDYINVREFGSVERSVYAGMKYNDFMKFAKNPNPVTVGGVGGIGQYVYDYTDGIDFVLAFMTATELSLTVTEQFLLLLWNQKIRLLRNL